MKRWVSAAVLAATLLVAGVAFTAPKAGSKVTVRVLSAKVMRDPKFIGQSLASVSRGEHLVFQEAKQDWYKVATASGQVGWIHKGSVTDSQVNLSSKPGGGAGGATQDEVELAGRGFTPEVEQQYRAKHGNLDFSHVDAIEQTSVDPDALGAFAQEGKVMP